MKKLDIYIGKIILLYVSLVFVVFAGIEALIEFTREFPDLGSGYYGIMQIFTYVPLLLPNDLYDFASIAIFIGSLIGLGLLSSNQELTVMRTSGLSSLRIFISVGFTISILAVFVFIIGEFLAPNWQYRAIKMKTEAISGGKTFVTKQGIWFKYENNFIRINKFLPDGHLEKISYYTLDDNNKLKHMGLADSGNYDNKSGKWILNNVKQTTVLESGTSTSNFATLKLNNINMKPRFFELMASDRDEKTLVELYKYIKYLKQSGLNANSYKFTFWKRLIKPMSILVIALISVPCIFGPLRSSHYGVRLIFGGFLSFLFYIMNQFAEPLSELLRMSPSFAAALPTLISFLFLTVIVFKFSRT